LKKFPFSSFFWGGVPSLFLVSRPFFSPFFSFVVVSKNFEKQILPAISSLLEDAAQLVVLVKPQFEAGKGSVGSGGVVRDEGVRREVLAAVVAAVPEAARFSVSSPFDAAPEEEEKDGGGDVAAAAAAVAAEPLLLPPKRFVLQGTMESPIRGATSGNVEYLAHFTRG
jgi:predicted rRNA methylase YqxC with S4 and FtsJ domains